MSVKSKENWNVGRINIESW